MRSGNSNASGLAPRIFTPRIIKITENPSFRPEAYSAWLSFIQPDKEDFQETSSSSPIGKADLLHLLRSVWQRLTKLDECHESVVLLRFLSLLRIPPTIAFLRTVAQLDQVPIEASRIENVLSYLRELRLLQTSKSNTEIDAHSIIFVHNYVRTTVLEKLPNSKLGRIHACIGNAYETLLLCGMKKYLEDVELEGFRALWMGPRRFQWYWHNILY